MNQFFTNAYTTELASLVPGIRRGELKRQNWNRAKSQLIADNEDLILTDAHWGVLKFMRTSYAKAGLPRHARYLSDSLDKGFAAEGGGKYLRNLFPGGVVTQGSRFANLPTPADATDTSYGTCY